jgi:hypothetical protein
MIKKFEQFENLKLKFKHIINEDLSDPGINNELKELTDELYKNKIDGYVGSISDITYTIKINYNMVKYYSSVPTKEILDSIISDKPLNFILKVDVPVSYDNDYMISVIIHEIRHIYDMYTITKEKHFNSFVREQKIQTARKNINDVRFSKFLNCVYYSLLHELVARNNQVYPIIKNKKINKEDCYEMIKNTFIYSTFDYLDSFNSNEFINEFHRDELSKFTNDFNNLYCSVDKEIESIEDYYKKWEIFFKKTKDRWYDEMKLEIDKIYETIGSNHQIVENECSLLLTWIIDNFIIK